MRCNRCVAECKASGGLCGPINNEMRSAAVALGIALTPARRDHARDAHAMYLQGALWRCVEGHEAEASAYEVMVGAGVRPML